jgi:magnesium transporter
LQERLLTLPDDDRRWLQSSLEYKKDSVGELMSHEMVVVRDHLAIDAVLAHLRDLSQLPLHTDKIFIVDRRGVLRGVVALQTLLLTAPAVPVNEVMATDVVIFTPDEQGSDAAQAFERYDLISAPVVNEHGKLLGRLTVDVMMDYIRVETTEEVLNFAGLRGEEDLFSSIWNSARNRWLWLSINLLTAFVASRVIGLFESTIAQLVALASLMPIVASIGGNTGNQTTALIIRGIALGQVNASNAFHLLRKELGVSLLNGAVIGALVGIFAYLFYGSPALGGVIAAAIVFNLLIAALVGMVVPLLLERFGRDPALGSSVLLTATTDSMGFFIFLGLASLFLL